MSKPDSRTGLTSPPAGTGNTPGFGEAFRINMNTGQGVYSYKLAVPEGVAGHTPTIVLEYAHGTGLGPFGMGWRLGQRSISRRLDYGVPDEGVTERFHDTGNEIAEMPDGSHCALIETAFTRYTRIGGGWRVEERNGIVHEFGMSAGTRVVDPDHPDRIHEYLLERTLDTSENEVRYSYDIDLGVSYITEIRYAVYAVRFLYEDRPDVRHDGRAGFPRARKRRCRAIELYLDPELIPHRIRSWTLTYEMDPLSDVSLLASLRMTSHSPTGDVVRTPVTFAYARFNPLAHTIRLLESEDGPEPPPLTDPDTALITLDNAPLPGVLQVVSGEQFYWPNRGNGKWGYPQRVAKVPAVASFTQSGVLFVDADASGTADMIIAGADPLHGYFENGGREGWARFVAYPRSRAAAPEWNSGRIRLTDADGDGRVDAIMSSERAFTLWINLGPDGWSEPILAPRGMAEDRLDTGFDDPLVLLADMTGDGLQDLVRIRSGRVDYWPSLGRGRFGPAVRMERSPRMPDLQRATEGTFIVDVDGDGCADLVCVTARGVEVSYNRNGQSFSDPVLIDTVPPPIPRTVRPVNMSGESRAGLVWNSPRRRETAYVQLEFGEARPSYVLTGVDNGAGLSSELFYRWAIQDQLEDFRKRGQWNTNLPFPIVVVAGTSEVDRTTGQTTDCEYRYHEGHYEARTRQFQGFRRADRIDKGDESRADVLTVFHFLMAEERQPGNGPEYAALNGLQSRVETFSLDGTPMADRPLRVEECTYGLQVIGEAKDGRKRAFVFASSHWTEDSERTGDVRVEEKTYTYDAVGNVIVERLRGFGTRSGAAVLERERLTEIEYASTASRYIVDRPSRVVVRDENSAIVTEKRRYYDGPDFAGLPFGQLDRGLAIRDEQLLLSEQAFQTHYLGMDPGPLGYHAAPDKDGTPSRFTNTERFAYGQDGVRIADRDAVGNERRYEYDAARLFRIKLIDSLGETHFEYDRATGQPTHVFYADGAEAQFILDAQGRVIASLISGDDPANPPRTFLYDDTAVPSSRTARYRTAEVVSTVTYYDGRGKECQQRIEAGGGRVIVTGLRVLNPWGGVKQEFEPTDATSLAFSPVQAADLPSRRIFFDGRGRVIRTLDFGGGESRAEYRAFETIVHDANDTDASAAGHFNTPRREEFDVFRNRTRVIDELGGGAEAGLSYTVNSAGDLLDIRDSHGVLCSYEYDRMGHRLVAAHREAGTRRLFYDGRGNVVRAVDANGNDLSAEIDAMGRLTRLSAGGGVIEQYTYDDPARNALGRLAEVMYAGGSQHYRYDAAGRVVEHEHRFSGVEAPHTRTYEYDAQGRQVAVRHSDGTRIAQMLTANGWVAAIPGFVDEVVYNARGLPTRISFSNGVVTEMTYTDGPGRVATQRTRGPNGGMLEDIAYSYDRMRMLLGQNDVAPGGFGNQTFEYDPLYQLRRATAPDGTRQYPYVDHFNLARLEEAERELHHDDAAHPNRIAGLTESASPRFNTAYDANGNLLSLPRKTFQYNAKGELERFKGEDGLVADYRYDHQGARISKTVSSGGGTLLRTVFVDRDVEIRDGVPAYFVRLGDLRVAIRQDGTTRFVHSNYLGSTAFFTDQAGTKIAAIAWRPFGNVASSSGDVDLRTYGSHPFDTESGLYYMGRRYFAPEIARFLTPDSLALFKPQKFLGRPRALHPYAYSGNDPLNNTDPEGLSFWSVIGAIVGVIAAIALAAVVVMTGGLAGVLIGAAILVGVVAVSYVVADATAGSSFGEFMRGFMIGLNAGLNAILATAIFGPGVGLAVGVLNFMAAIDEVAANPAYQGMLGWASWLMPMSWLATAVGLIFFVINLIVGFFAHTIPNWLGGSGWDAARINSVSIDWGTGTIVMHGGLLTPVRGGYNLGNFAYIHRDSTFSTSLVAHETGHTLSVAAFGSIFHFVGAIDENVVPGRGPSAYAEKLADSHDPTRAVADATAWQEIWV
jgi:RHS repeat-associated protein